MTYPSPRTPSHPVFKKIYQDEAAWVIREDFLPLLPGNLLDTLQHHDQYPEFTLLRDNNVRSSFLLKLPGGGDRSVFIKRYKVRGLQDVWKYSFFPSKAALEWKSLRNCEEWGLPMPRPLAVAEKRSGVLLKDSCIILEALTQASPLNEYLERQLPGFPPEQLWHLKQSLALSLAQLVRDVHKKGIFYRDLHAGNILIKTIDSGACELFLIDLHRALFPPVLMQWMRVRDLAQLCNSLSATQTDKLRFLKEYCRAGQLSKKSFYDVNKKLAAAADRMEKTRIKSRSKRCVKNSTTFEVATSFGERYCGRRDFGRGACRQAIASHLSSLVRDEAQVLKKTAHSIMTTHAEEKELPVPVCVKGYRSGGLRYALKSLAVTSRAMKSWIAGNSLLVRGINTPRPQALLEKKYGPVVLKSFLITEWLAGSVELNDYIAGLCERCAPRAAKDSFIAALARSVRDLHAQAVYHADLKSTNILVCEAGNDSWKFYFVDLDRVRFNKNLTFRERANNLAQINASVSSYMMAKDRLKFFRFYAKGTPFFRERKNYYKEILNISRTKNTEPFGVKFTS